MRIHESTAQPGAHEAFYFDQTFILTQLEHVENISLVENLFLFSSFKSKMMNYLRELFSFSSKDICI